MNLDIAKIINDHVPSHLKFVEYTETFQGLYGAAWAGLGRTIHVLIYQDTTGQNFIIEAMQDVTTKTFTYLYIYDKGYSCTPRMVAHH